MNWCAAAAATATSTTCDNQKHPEWECIKSFIDQAMSKWPSCATLQHVNLKL